MYNPAQARQQAEAREREEKQQRALELKIINAGYKALATKLHPDHGGSGEAMIRLNAARDRLKKTL